MHEELFLDRGLSLDRLKTFIEIVAAGSITAAAKGDANRQSQFSRQLKELETFFGTELALRGRGQFELTRAGRQLNGLAQLHLAALKELRQNCADQPIEMRIGAGESVIHWVLLPNLRKFGIAEPNTRLVLSNLRTEEIIERIANGRLDVGVVRTDSVPKSLRAAKLFTLEYRVFLRNGLISPQESNKPLNLFEKLSWAVLYDRHYVTLALEEAAKALGVSLSVSVVCGSFTQVADAVRAVNVAAVVPSLAQSMLDTPTFDQLEFPFLKPLARPMVLVWNPTLFAVRPAVSRAARIFGAILRAS